MKDNAHVIEKGIRKAREIIDGRILKSLKETAFYMDNLRPFDIKWTGNLLDSIGCGIYQDGVFITFVIPDQIASDPRSGEAQFPADTRDVEGSERPIYGGKDNPNLDNIDIFRPWWGTEELANMLMSPPPEIANMTDGFALYYVAAMPYAYFVDQIHGGTVLEEQAVHGLFTTIIKSYARN